MENSPVLFPEIAAKRPTTLSKDGWEKAIVKLPEFGLKLFDYDFEDLVSVLEVLQVSDLANLEDIYDALSGEVLSTEICFDDDDEEFEETRRPRELLESWHDDYVIENYKFYVAQWAEGEIQRDPEFFKPIKPGTCLQNPCFYKDIDFSNQKTYPGVVFVGSKINENCFYVNIVSVYGYQIGYIPFEERFEEVEELRFELRKPISHPKVKESYEVGTVKTHREWIELLKLKSEDLVLPFFGIPSEHYVQLHTLSPHLADFMVCFQYGDGENSGALLYKRFEEIHKRNMYRFYKSLCDIDRMKFDKHFLTPQKPSSNV